jgi:RNA polymerase sigma-70 factor (subfamily 1)
MGMNQDGLDDLLLKAIGGDTNALGLLLMHFHDPLCQFIQSVILGRNSLGVTMEDVLQETLIGAFQGIDKFEARGPEAFFAWLRIIARTRLINLLKGMRAQKRGGGVPAIAHSPDVNATATSILNLIAANDPSPSLHARRTEAASAIAVAMAALTPEQRQLMEWRFGEGLPFQEIAARAGKNESAVKMMIHRTIKELRQKIGNDFGEFSFAM